MLYKTRRRTGVRTLDNRDLDAVREVLAQDPVASVFVAARVAAYGLESWRLGCPIHGYFRDGELVALCHQGTNLVPVEADAEAIEGFVRALPASRRCSSIVGPVDQALSLWNQMSERWGRPWATVREIRASQPMMALSGPPAVAPHPGLRRIGREHADAYFDAAVKMYTEEVGVSPLTGGSPSPYRTYIDQVIAGGRAFGIVDTGRVIYKSDIGAAAQGVGQIQGVWLDPAYRGQGLAVPAMAGVAALAREEFDTISLYVNSFNLPARATYQKVGFAEVGEFATVLY